MGALIWTWDCLSANARLDFSGGQLSMICKVLDPFLYAYFMKVWW